MVTLGDILSSNAQVASSFPPGLVALFVGATSGIGAATLKAFAKYTRKPRAYFVGRSQEAADAIILECLELNPDGEYIFIQADVSLLKVVDQVSAQIRAREPHLNILFLSQGVARFDRCETAEGLHLLASLAHYSRVRFIARLLPLLKAAPIHRRVITVGAAGMEGPLDPSDFPALRIPPDQLRGHLTTLITLGLEAVARSAPRVSFIHDYPGAVDTPLTQEVFRLMGRDGAAIDGGTVPELLSAEESGERHVYLLTSPRYPSAEGVGGTVLVGAGSSREEVVRGTNGELGSGFYDVGFDGESASSDTLEFLAGLRRDGMVEKVRNHTDDEFRRITGQGLQI
ncbi:hypothetical protein BJY01DRAFT_260167 [Aspergillus pseudoustus]|uniref:Short-chain dehydrogenases/reductase n=1 Tax=Aspergillus pseudoustus TaxID=1810923 RepID=A0ABR4KIK1_9EURO